MLRDYSSERQQSLMRISKMCEEKGFLNAAWDRCLDVPTRFAVSLDLLKADGAMFDFDGDLQAYQACIIDAENLQASEIRKIFEACRAADSGYGAKFEFVGNSLDTVTAGLNDLAEAINPALNTLTTQAMTSIGERIDRDMEAIRKETRERMDQEISAIETKLVGDSLFEVVKDTLSFGGDVAAFVGGCATAAVTGKWSDVLCDGYDMLGDFMAGCHDLEALATVGQSYLLGLGGGDNTESRLNLLEHAQKSKDTESLKDVFSNQVIGGDNSSLSGGDKLLNAFWGTMGTTCGVAETMEDIYGVVDSIGGIPDAVDSTVDSFKKGGIIGGIRELTGLTDEGLEDVSTKVEKIDKKLEKAERAKTEWYRIKRIDKLRKDRIKVQSGDIKSKIGKIKDGIEFAEGLIKGDLLEKNSPDKDLGSTLVGKTIKTAKDFYDDYIEGRTVYPGFPFLIV